MATHNPWCGLASYKDPSKTSIEHKFCGREPETLELVKLIDNNLFVTLYGRTGVGKTSLLNAGVFPILRQRGYFPIYIRLSQETTNKTYAEAIVQKIRNSGITEHSHTAIDNKNHDTIAYLWNYFGTTKFTDKKGNEVYPVIVLDQFEEIFHTHTDDAKLLLQQINALITGNYVMPDIEGFSDATNYRFVASIREDNLYMLEDCIDELSLNQYKENRFRLKPLNEEMAKRAILEPGFGCIDHDTKDDIATKIIELSKDKDGKVSSLILSLICGLMYEQAKKINGNKPIITLHQIPQTKENTDRLLADFYIANTTKKQREIIEEHLLTVDGHRKAEKVFIPNVENLLASGNHILQRIETDNGEKIEITHDRLAKVIYMQRRQRDDHKFRNLARAVITSLLVIAFYGAIYLSWTYTAKDATFLKPYSVYKPDYDPQQRLLEINDSIAKYTIISEKNPCVRIDIGKNVVNLDSLQIMKDSITINIDPKNKNFKWGYILDEYPNRIHYLYAVDNPNKAIYIQRDVYENKNYRLPDGIKTLLANGKNITQDSNQCSIGTQHCDDSNFSTKWKHDKELRSVYLKEQRNLNASFKDCTNLENVILEMDSCTIGQGCFEHCERLRNIKLPRIMSGQIEGLFQYCWNLDSVYLPDIIDYDNRTDDISLMFMDTNPKHIFFSKESHFKEDPTNHIIYYDSIPVIFSKCTDPNWCMKDSLVFISNAIVYKCKYIYDRTKDERNDKIIWPICVLPQFVDEAGIFPKMDNYWNIFENFSRSSDSILNHTYIIRNPYSSITGGFIHTTIQKGKASIMSLPSFTSIWSMYDMTHVNLDSIKEIHLPLAYDGGDYRKLLLNSYAEKHNITLYVPWGSREVYENVHLYDNFIIAEDGIGDHVMLTLHNWWEGIASWFGIPPYSYILGSLTLIGLLVVFFFIFFLKKKQMKNNGIIDEKRVIGESLLAMLIAFIGFLPAYWLTWVILTQHTNFGLGYVPIMAMTISSISGIIPAWFCAYLFVFAGRGKVFDYLERYKKKE